MKKVWGILSLLVACFAPVAFAQDTQYTAVASAINSPTLPFVSPSYTPDGSFTVLVTNGNCAGTYTINASPVAGSGPSGTTPPLTEVTTYINFGAGSFLFDNAGPGRYTVTVTETGACNPPIDPVVFTVTVVDLEATPYSATTTKVDTTLPYGAPGFQNDGSFTVTIANGNCVGTYTVNAAPILGSGPFGSTPVFTTVTTYIGFGQGNFLFDNAGPGRYQVTVTETGSCQFAAERDPTTLQVTVGKGPVVESVPVPVNAPLALLFAALGLAAAGVRQLRRR